MTDNTESHPGWYNFPKGDKHCLKNYCSAFLLPISRKIFEKINQVLNLETCINQHIFVTHNIVNLLDEGLEVRGVFLDISTKGCDKVWHRGLTYKMQLNGELGDLLDTLTYFLNNRRQWVVLDDQTYEWPYINAEVLQSSSLGLLMFLIYINHLPDDLYISVKLFASDTPLFDC